MVPFLIDPLAQSFRVTNSIQMPDQAVIEFCAWFTCLAKLSSYWIRATRRKKHDQCNYYRQLPDPHFLRHILKHDDIHGNCSSQIRRYALLVDLPENRMPEFNCHTKGFYCQNPPICLDFWIWIPKIKTIILSYRFWFWDTLIAHGQILFNRKGSPRVQGDPYYHSWFWQIHSPELLRM